MGLDIKGNFKESPKYHGGYGGFFRLRYNVAKAVMGEGIQIYDAWIKTTSKDSLEYIRMLNEKIYSYGAGFYKFVTSSDVGGNISYKDCKEIYDKIKESGLDFTFSYEGYDVPKDNIRDLMLECYSHRSKLVWY